MWSSLVKRDITVEMRLRCTFRLVFKFLLGVGSSSWASVVS